MNFLAHFYLSAPEKHLIVGGFLGDFVKGPLRGDFESGLESGIRLHRHIDTLTDSHPAQKSIKQCLPDNFYRYSGIIADMMCDHFLSKHWHRFHETALETFSADCIGLVKNQQAKLIGTASDVLERMDEGDWLLHYRDLNYICGAISRIGTRLRYANPLGEIQKLMPSLSQQIEPDCLKILNDTRGAVTKWRSIHLAETVL